MRTSASATATRKSSNAASASSNSLADNSPDIIARFDRQLHCIYVNPAITAATGGTPEQFIADMGGQLALSPEGRALLVSALQQALETGRATTVEVAVRGRAEQCYHTVVVPEQQSDGQVETVLIIGRSVGDLKRVERGAARERRTLAPGGAQRRPRHL